MTAGNFKPWMASASRSQVAVLSSSCEWARRSGPPCLELFGRKKGDIGISYLRISLGSSDINDHPFTYDDPPSGETDPDLAKFSLGPDQTSVVPVLRQVLAINPSIPILATPSSAPAWMKTNDKLKGGSLRKEDYEVYARYFLKYVRTMKANGIPIAAVTPQNEPLNPDNTPSLVMQASEEDQFIRQSLGPTFRQAGVPTKIFIYDHNCDRPDYPLAILADPQARQFIDGSAFHLYAGDITALTKVHDAWPDKDLYFTGQMVVDDPDHPQQRKARLIHSLIRKTLSPKRHGRMVYVRVNPPG